MSYCGYVVKVDQIRKHTNADRLQVATFFGNDTIVGMDTHQGDIGVYFPSDGQLSERFCQVNDLVRRKDENGNPAGGYMDPVKRNVKPIKLRGEKSDGLYLPITCLAEFCAISDLNVGDKIDVLNGEEICRKYIPRPSTQGYSGKTSRHHKAKVNYAPTFYEHVDTEQLAYNLNQFKPGDIVQLTLKMHGCFAYDTRVRMADGKQKRIQNIKPGEKVLGYNFETKKFEAATVLNAFHNAPSKNWRAVKISRDHLCGDKRGVGFKCTPNHPFWSEEFGGWIEAKNLEPGMKISCLFPSLLLTQRQKEIAAGNYLGDGCLQQFDDKTAEIQSGSKVKEYSDFMEKATSGLYYNVNQKYTSGYGTEMYRTRSKRSADMYNFFDEYVLWDNSSGNKLKENFYECITPLSLAVFYMDDGSLSHNETQKDRASFAICDYNEHDSEIICECFRKYDIEPIYYKDSKGYSRIRLNTEEAYKFFNLIKTYIPKCMRYKLPEDIDWVDKTDNIFNKEENETSYVFSQQKVLSNKSIIAKRGWYEYDLETSLHNYVVGYSLVHNTSGRTGCLPILKTKRTMMDKLLHRHGKDYYDYDYVTGTRRVVLDGKRKGGHYDSDEWRLAMAAKFDGKLNKGETVYYEIVGFQGPKGAPIMGQVQNSKIKDKEFSKQYGDVTTFSYGCEQTGDYEWKLEESIEGETGDPVGVPPCCELYVYRMTMVNADGDVVEYSPAQIKYRCEQMGIKTVMEFETFIIPDMIQLPDDVGSLQQVNPGEYVLRKVEQYFDGPDPIGKTHIREGVVARILNRSNFAVYKHKNFSFKVLEGIAKDEATAPDIEEAQEDVNDCDE